MMLRANMSSAQDGTASFQLTTTATCIQFDSTIAIVHLEPAAQLASLVGKLKLRSCFSFVLVCLILSVLYISTLFSA